MKLQKDLREFIELLNSHGVEYLVVGGHAVAYHGHPRYTGDIDFFVRPSAQNAARVVAVVAAFGFADAGFDVATFTEPNRVIQLGRPPHRIDILTSISGLSFDEAWADRVESEIDQVAVSFIGKAALIANKRASRGGATDALRHDSTIDDCELDNESATLAVECVDERVVVRAVQERFDAWKAFREGFPSGVGTE